MLFIQLYTRSRGRDTTRSAALLGLNRTQSATTISRTAGQVRAVQCRLHYIMKRVQRLILICFAECGRTAGARQQRPGAQCERDARGAAPPCPGARPLPRPLLPAAGGPPGGLHADRSHGHAHHSGRGRGPGSHPQHPPVRTSCFF